MILKNTTFEAFITDSTGRTLDAECKISEPLASGQPATISVVVFIKNKNDIKLANPCTLQSKTKYPAIELKDLWYRSIFVDTSSEKYTKATFEINHIGQLSINTAHSSNT